MRRTPAFTMLASVILAGCLEEPSTYTDLEQTISVEVNGEFIIALSANPTTGHSWQESYDQAALKLKERTFTMGQSAKEDSSGPAGPRISTSKH